MELNRNPHDGGGQEIRRLIKGESLKFNRLPPDEKAEQLGH